jgi:hypothetical protein
MKKIVLGLVLLTSMGLGLVTSLVHAAAQSDDLAIGDPETPGWKRTSKKHGGTKPGATQAEPAQPAEPKGQTGETTKPAEPAKPAEPPAK